MLRVLANLFANITSRASYDLSGYSKSKSCLLLGSSFSVRYFNILKLLHYYNADLISCNANCCFHGDIASFLTGYVSTQPFYYFKFPAHSSFALKRPYSVNDSVKYEINNMQIAALHSELPNLSSVIKLFHLSSWPAFYRQPNCRYVYRSINFEPPCTSFFPSTRFKTVALPVGGALTASLALASLMGYEQCYLIGFDSMLLDVYNNIRFYDVYSDYKVRSLVDLLDMSTKLDPFSKISKLKPLLLPQQTCSISGVYPEYPSSDLYFDDPLSLECLVKPKHINFFRQYQEYNCKAFNNFYST